MRSSHITHFFLFTYILFFNFNIKSQEIIIKNGDNWSYFDEGYLDNNWAEKVNIYKWKEGNAPLGYGDEEIETIISYGSDPENKEIVEYFKKEIYIDKNKFHAFEFKLSRDDGAVIYINGKLLYLSNMGNSMITNSSKAIDRIDGSDESKYQINIFEKNIFRQGKNTIAVSIHQAYEDSSDLRFSLELIGYNSLDQIIKSQNTNSEELKHQIKDLNSKFILETTNHKNEILKSSNTNLKIFIFIISILFIICVFAIYFIIINFKKKDLLNKKHLHKKNEECLEKDKEMIYLSSKVLNSKQFLKELKADIKGLSTQDNSEVKNIIKEIDNILKNEEEWDILKRHFSIVYSGFYNNLLEKHPDLSESDLRHCMFIKLHMQTKEIARILLIDPRSVQTTRYRIKKKLNLKEDEDLRQYLLKI